MILDISLVCSPILSIFSNLITCHRNVILTRFLAPMFQIPYTYKQTENIHYFSFLVFCLHFNFSSYFWTNDISLCVKRNIYLVPLFNSSSTIKKKAPMKWRSEALKSFTFYSFCLNKYFAWKILLPKFPPIWCLIIRLVVVSNFYCLVNVILLSSYFNWNTSEICVKVSQNK